MPSRNELNNRARVVGLDPATIPNDSKLEQHVLHLEKHASAVTGTAASTTLTSDNTNPTEGDTVTIGSLTYTFNAVLTALPGSVLLDASVADNSMNNLIAAINGSATVGTTYSQKTKQPHPDVSAGTLTSHAVVITARDTNYGDDIATTETSSHLSFTGTTMASGVAGVIADAGAFTRFSADAVSGSKQTNV